MNNFLTLSFISIFLMTGCLKKKCHDITPTNPNTSSCVHNIASWQDSTSISTSDLGVSFFLNDKLGWVAGANGVIFKTTDGGNSFTAQSSGTSQMIVELFFLDANNGYAGGGSSDPNGIVLKTTNGGTAWTPVISGIGSVRSMYFFSLDTGFVGGSLGELRKTTNGGASWTTINTGVSTTLYDLKFINKNIGYACGAFGLIKTIDGGNTWNPLLTSLPSGINNAFYALDFIDKNNGYAVGYALSNDKGYIVKTSDGQNWTSSTYPSEFFTDVVMTDSNTSYILGGNPGTFTPGIYGDIYKVSGITGNRVKYSSQWLTSLSFLGCNKVIVTGDNGFILRGDQ